MKSIQTRFLKFTAPLLVALLLWGPTLAQATGGGVRGGGQVYDVNGSQELFSLLTTSKCEISKSGYKMMQEIPLIEETLEKIAAIDWYLAFEFRREIGYLDFCFTGPLKWTDGWTESQRKEAERQSIHKKDPREIYTENWAIRVNRVVFIDRNLFDQQGNPGSQRRPLTPEEVMERRTNKVFHEMMHSYYDDMNDLRRKEKMSGMEKLIVNIREGIITDTDGLYSSFRTNGFYFPQTHQILAANREAITFLLNDSRQQLEMIMKAEEIDDLWDIDLTSVLPHLSWWDAKAFAGKGKPSEQFDRIFRGLLKASTLDGFSRLVNLEKPTSRNLLELSYSILPELEKKKRKILSEGKIALDTLNGVLARLATNDFSVSDGMIVVKGGLTELSIARGYSFEIVPTLSLVPRPSADFTPSLRTAVNVLRVLKRYNSPEKFLELTEGNSLYRAALYPDASFLKVDALPGNVRPEDRELSKRAIERNLSAIRAEFARQIP
jgi:hypothetical protein